MKSESVSCLPLKFVISEDNMVYAFTEENPVATLLTKDDFSKVSINLTENDITLLPGYMEKHSDGLTTVVVHSDGTSFFVNGSPKTLEQVASLLPQSNSPILLLSCADLEAAKQLSAKLGRTVYTNDGITRLHSDGGITTLNKEGTAPAKWYEIKSDGTQVEYAFKEGTAAEEFVELGKVSVLDDGKNIENISQLFSGFTDFYKIKFKVNESIHTISWSHIDDGCAFRAHLLCEYLSNKGISNKKIFAFAIDAYNAGLLSVKSLYAQDSKYASFDKPLQDWQYHVACYIDDPKFGKYVIDPAIADHPISINEWMKNMNSEKFTIKEREAYSKICCTGDGSYYETDATIIIVDNEYIAPNDLPYAVDRLNASNKIETNIDYFIGLEKLEKCNIMAKEVRLAMVNKIPVEDLIKKLSIYDVDTRKLFAKRYRFLLDGVERYDDEYDEILGDFLYGKNDK